MVEESKDQIIIDPNIDVYGFFESSDESELSVYSSKSENSEASQESYIYDVYDTKVIPQR